MQLYENRHHGARQGEKLRRHPDSQAEMDRRIKLYAARYAAGLEALSGEPIADDRERVIHTATGWIKPVAQDGTRRKGSR